MAEIIFPRNREYKDMSLSMGRNPVTNDIIAVTSEEAVKRSIKNLLNTNAGEVPFFPDFGTRINELLFEPIDPITTVLLEGELRATIEAFEPRARILTLTATASEDENRYNIYIVFRLNNLAEPVTLSLFLSRLR